MTSMISLRCFALAALVATPSAAIAAEDTTPAEINLMVLRENASGSASAAQGYIDNLVTAIATTSGWASAAGKYVSRRTSAERYIAETKPQFGILSLSAYLAMRTKHDLTALGEADISQGGGHQFFVVSKGELSLAGCKAKRLGTNHGDTAFVDKIVSGDDFDLSDFQVEDTRRPVKTLKAVVAGDVDCALIDDAQLMELQHVEGGLDVHPVWSSKPLPPMVVAAFPSADDGQRKAFSKALDAVCDGHGKEACEATSIKLAAKDAAAFAEYERAYGG